MKQGTEEWFNIKKGRASASEFSKILTPTGKPSASAIPFARRLARECLCDDPLDDRFESKHMKWGKEIEPEARRRFEEVTGILVDEVGFCLRDDRATGCSPDGLIKFNGEFYQGLEIKCPSVDKHVEYLMNGTLPKEYALQVHGSMAVTGFNSWYFMSYFPGLKDLIIKVERDEFTEKVNDSLNSFVDQYKKIRTEVFEKVKL